jgi:hypothetical protein
MKIILSRKGFDAANGGGPSPIFPDGRLLSLPIPSSSSPTRFSDCRWGEHTIGDLVESLSGGRIPRDAPAHLDPDLDPGARPRAPGWRAAFGQTGAAQSHLAKHAIGPGDLFLFFGWFKAAEATADGAWQFKSDAPNQHVLFGWLQVGDVLPVGRQTTHYAQTYPWLRDHPHLCGQWDAANTVYLATDTLIVFGQDVAGRAGAGVFSSVSQARTLTDRDQPLRSRWRLPSWLFQTEGSLSLSYHDKDDRWSRAPDGSTRLDSVARGQEFVLTTDRRDEVSVWLSEIFAMDPAE